MLIGAIIYAFSPVVRVFLILTGAALHIIRNRDYKEVVNSIIPDINAQIGFIVYFIGAGFYILSIMFIISGFEIGYLLIHLAGIILLTIFNSLVKEKK